MNVKMKRFRAKLVGNVAAGNKMKRNKIKSIEHRCSQRISFTSEIHYLQLVSEEELTEDEREGSETALLSLEALLFRWFSLSSKGALHVVQQELAAAESQTQIGKCHWKIWPDGAPLDLCTRDRRDQALNRFIGRR
jgi:hypothetical protein